MKCPLSSGKDSQREDWFQSTNQKRWKDSLCQSTEIGGFGAKKTLGDNLTKMSHPGAENFPGMDDFSTTKILTFERLFLKS